MAIASVVFSLNGQDTVLTLSDGVYSGTVTAPSKSSGSNNNGQGPDIGAAAQGKGFYPGKVTITDDAGNVTTIDTTDGTWGNVLKLKVLEKTLPTALITYPSASAVISNAKPTITFSLSDSGSGVDPSAVFIKIDDGNFVAVTGVTVDGVSASGSYTPATALSEGSHTVQLYCKDFDGNQSTTVSSTFTVDINPPTLSITSPADGIKVNTPRITVAGVTSDSISSSVDVTIKVGGTSYTPEVQADGSFSQEVELAEGPNAIEITATDASGLSTTITRNVTLDTKAPVPTKITLTPNPVDGGATYVISVTVSD